MASHMEAHPQPAGTKSRFITRLDGRKSSLLPTLPAVGSSLLIKSWPSRIQRPRITSDPSGTPEISARTEGQGKAGRSQSACPRACRSRALNTIRAVPSPSFQLAHQRSGSRSEAIEISLLFIGGKKRKARIEAQNGVRFVRRESSLRIHLPPLRVPRVSPLESLTFAPF